jgi:hypothetical protein
MYHGTPNRLSFEYLRTEEPHTSVFKVTRPQTMYSYMLLFIFVCALILCHVLINDNILQTILEEITIDKKWLTDKILRNKTTILKEQGLK